MKGLDDYITGVHDPNAPFNQEHWVEYFDPITSLCNWLTDTLLDDATADDMLEGKMTEIWEKAKTDSGIEDFEYTHKRTQRIAEFMRTHAVAMAKELTEFYRTEILYKTYIWQAANIFAVRNSFLLNHNTNLSEFIPPANRLEKGTRLVIHKENTAHLWTDKYVLNRYIDEVTFHAEQDGKGNFDGLSRYPVSIKTRYVAKYKHYQPIIIEPEFVVPYKLYHDTYVDKNYRWSTGLFCFNHVKKIYQQLLRHDPNIEA
jgi:hypothetical protein